MGKIYEPPDYISSTSKVGIALEMGMHVIGYIVMVFIMIGIPIFVFKLLMEALGVL